MAESLFHTIGGAPTIEAVVDDLYERLQHDPLVQHQFTPERLPSLKAGQRRWFTAVLGGGEPIPRPDLAKAHASVTITDEDVAAVLGHLREALEANGVSRQVADRVVAIVSRLWYARSF